MTLFRTRTMLKAEIIGDLFGVSATVVSRTCLTWWRFMAGELKSLVYNPPQEVCKALLPTHPNTAYCTEVFTETPKMKLYKLHYPTINTTILANICSALHQMVTSTFHLRDMEGEPVTGR